MATYTFESVADFGRAMKRDILKPMYENAQWSGETYAESLDRAINGDTRRVAEASWMRGRAALCLKSR